MSESFRSILYLIRFHTYTLYVRKIHTIRRYERDRLVTTMVYEWCMTDNYAQTKVRIKSNETQRSYHAYLYGRTELYV